MTAWMIYGANGYTGELIAREAVRRGLLPILAGRNAEQITALAKSLDLDSRVFSLDAPDLDGVGLVLHCAGPFSRTSRAMVDACLAAGAHYLDITGEIEVFETIYARDAEARNRGVALIPGVGFDVVPTDCLAAKLAADLPHADELLLAFSPSRGGRTSRGTMRTAIEGMSKGGAVRREGRIVQVPLAFDVREVPFPGGPKTAVTIPWGDISSAFRSTGIPNIRVYMAASRRGAARMKRLARLAWVTAFPGVTSLMQRFVAEGGPSAEQRTTGRVELWGHVSRGSEERTMTITTPEGYEFTVRSALAAVERLLDRSLSGALTPSQAFGAGFAESIEGVVVGD